MQLSPVVIVTGGVDATRKKRLTVCVCLAAPTWLAVPSRASERASGIPRKFLVYLKDWAVTPEPSCLPCGDSNPNSSAVKHHLKSRQLVRVPTAGLRQRIQAALRVQ